MLFYWSVPARLPILRASVLLSFSGIAIFIASPTAFFLGVMITIVTYLTLLPLHYWHKTNIILSTGISILIVITVASELFLDNHYLVTFGLSFMMLKAIALIIDIKNNVVGRPGFVEVATLHFFFPTFAAGPIESITHFNRQAFQKKISIDNVFNGVCRILVGFFKLSFISGTLLDSTITIHFEKIYELAPEYGQGMVFAYILIHFFNVYINFSGYTDIAVGAGKLFSLDIMENFDAPLLANNIQNFWRRWHLTLGRFVNQYLLLPLTRLSKGSVFLALFFAFTIIGVWHQISFPYLCWGLLHGMALAFHYILSSKLRNSKSYFWLKQNLFYSLFCRLLTITYVSWVSAFANSDGLNQSIGMTKTLLGL